MTQWDILLKLQTPATIDSDFAILVLNQPILCSVDLIKLLWTKAVYRAVADGGSNRWLDFIEKHSGKNLPLPDFISGDFDSIKSRTKSYFEEKKVQFIPTPDQDATDFSKALMCIADAATSKELKIKYVIAVCENGGRFDQIMGNISTLHQSNNYIMGVPVIMLSSQSILWLLPPGKHIIRVTEDFVKEEYPCGLIPFTGPTVITSSGLKWNLDNTVSEMGGMVSTSNTYAATEISIITDKPLVYTTQYSQVE